MLWANRQHLTDKAGPGKCVGCGQALPGGWDGRRRTCGQPACLALWARASQLDCIWARRGVPRRPRGSRRAAR